MSTSSWSMACDDGESGIFSHTYDICHRCWTYPSHSVNVRNTTDGFPTPISTPSTTATTLGAKSTASLQLPETRNSLQYSHRTTSHAASGHTQTNTHACEFCKPTPAFNIPGNMKPPSRIRNFAPSWFSVTMGTGVLPILLLNFPYPCDALFYPAAILQCLNVILFVSFSVVSILRYTLYPGVFWLMLYHPSQSLFLGAIPMGFATIVSGCAGLFPKGEGWGLAVEIMFWVDVAMTLITTFGVCFVMIKHHNHALPTMTAALLLPIVPLVVCASTGGAVAGLVGVNKGVIVTVSFLMWSCGLGLALSVIAVYLWRLLSHSLPPSAAIISSFLPVGPLGQGSFGILSLGILIPSSSTPSPFRASSFSATNSSDSGIIQPPASSPSTHHFPALLPEPAASTLRLVSFLMALFLLGLGTFYLLLAFSSVMAAFPRRFSVGWWASTFPVGTYALASGAIGKEMGNGFLKGVGAATSAMVALFWGVCVVGTVWRGVWKGEMFIAPCLDEKEGGIRDNVGTALGTPAEAVEIRRPPPNACGMDAVQRRQSAVRS